MNMVMRQRKKISIVVASCVNCPYGRFLEDVNVLWCDDLNKEIKSTGKKIGLAIFYHKIPKECRFPDTDELDKYGR